MKMTYTPFAAAKGVTCDKCGEPATVVLCADRPDPQTGYVDERALCNECGVAESEPDRRWDRE